MRQYAREMIGVIGLVLLGAGLYIERPSLAFIVDGSILAAVAVFGVARVGD